jgi:hypothetical protein
MENKGDQPDFKEGIDYAEPMPLPLLPVEDEKLYSAKELADMYHTGFVDGYNRAKDDIVENVIKPDPGCG